MNDQIFFRPGCLNSVRCEYNGTEFYALFDQKDSPGFGLGVVETEARLLTLRCLSSDINEVRHGDRVVVDGRDFLINRIRPRYDGNTTTLELTINDY